MSVKKAFDSIAEDWSNKRQFPHPPQIVFVKDWKGKILDLGCGNCVNLTIFEDSELYGIDFSEDMIKQAEEFIKDHEMKVILKVGDVLDTGYPDKYFDYVVFSKVLPNLNKKDHLDALLEIKRILKGKCFIACWNKNAEEHINGPKEKMIPWTYKGKTHQRYYYLYEEKELIDLIEKAGFKVEKKLSEWDSKNICMIISI